MFPYNTRLQHFSTTMLSNTSPQHPLQAQNSIQVEQGKPGAEVSKGKRTISHRKTLPFESFVTNLIPCLAPFSDDSKKVGICWLCHSSNCARQPVLDDAKSLPSCGRSQSATTCGCSYAPKNTQRYSVLQSATKYCSALTNYCKSITPYNKALLQYYSVLQSTTPALFRIQKYYSSTTLYYKEPLQYYSVLQSTTTYYSSRTVLYINYYKVYTTPVQLCTTK